jgi:hypothetical protein
MDLSVKSTLRMKLYNILSVNVGDRVSDNLWHDINKCIYKKINRHPVGYFIRHKIKEALFESFNSSTYSIGIKAQEYEFCRNAD